MTPEQRQTLIHELREFARAYPEDIFTPFTEEELKRHSVIITRASAAAGRHFAPWFLKAAAALKRIDDEGLMRQAQAACEAVVSIADSVGEGPFADALSGAELETFVAALEACEVAGDALRARLGEVPAQGEEADDEAKRV